VSAGRIDSLADVRPGDLMFAGMNSAPTRALVYAGQFINGEYVRVGQFVVGHVAVAGPRDAQDVPTIIEAMPSGARERPMLLSDWSPRTAFARLPEDYPGQADDAAAIARLFVTERVPYSFASYFLIALSRAGIRSERLHRRVDARRPPLGHQRRDEIFGHRGIGETLALPQEAICSVQAEQSWTLTGAEVVRGTRPQVVMPGMLARQLMHREGVIWGGAGIIR